MFRNYLKTALRNFKRQKVYALINILGLGVGLTCCILIYIYVAEELSFDNFHVQEKSIFRVMTSFHDKDGSVGRRGPAVPVAVAPLLKDYFPEISQTIRFARSSGTIRYKDTLANEMVTFTDSSVFEVFSFLLVQGNPKDVLSNDYSVVLTQSLADKYFRDQNPLGETLSITFGDSQKNFIVSGVAGDVPKNSTIQFTCLVHIQNYPLGSYPEALTSLGDFSFPLYIQLKDSGSLDFVESRLESFINQAFAAEFKSWGIVSLTERQSNPISFDLQRLRDMHFDTNSYDGVNPSSIFILMGIALIILVIASINFINLSIGRAAIRSVEIGMRKVIGASRKQLIMQFWSESLLLVFFALLLGIIMAVLFLPTFNQLSGKALTVAAISNGFTVLVLLFLLLFVAIASGSYPALVMSGVQPVSVFKGKLALGGRRVLAKTLVVIQFMLSVFLIISTIILSRQIRYMVEKDPGYMIEGLVAIRIQGGRAEDNQKVVDLFRNELRSYPNVISVSAVNTTFGRGMSMFPIEKDGQRIRVHQFRVDSDYIPTVGIKLIQGRGFSRERVTDSESAVVNQAFCKIFGITDPLGHTIGEFVENPRDDYPYNLRIIGVMEDYNVLSFKYDVQPVLLMMQPGWGMGNMIVRISNTQVSRTLDVLEKIWKKIRPEKPFVFSFIEDDLESQYNTEKKWNSIVQYSSIFAVLIACMGIFGLISLAVNRRFKEIGIRKVLGASVLQIFSLVTKEFLVLIAFANMAAWPVSFYVMRLVLNDYHYRITLGPQFFILAGVLSLLVALLTASYLAVKASLANPVDSLRYE